ncbi:glutathione S-transferase family protein [Sphaerotilaceae bacterium SBD11-9]
MTNPYTLYGAEISYFTGKVRAYLRWKGIPFDEVLATAEVYKQVIVPRVGFPVIPVMATPDGRTLQDSSEIIDTLERAHGEPSVIPAGGVQRLVSALFELYGDEWLVIPAMHYRWHHNREWAMRAFGEVNAPNATPEEQFAIGSRRAGPFAQAAVLLGAEPHMQMAVERSYESLLAELNQHFAAMPYLLGTRPSLGDFGLYGPLYAHQYRDPASGALMRRLAPNVVAWVERLRDAPSPRSGEFADGDALPPTLLPLLQRQMREQMPVLQDSAACLLRWLAEHPGERVPRVIGSHGFELEGQRGQRIVRPYSLWMLQRVLRVYRGLEGAERERADRLLDAVGGQALRGFGELPPLVRDGMSVALA